jgi:hypothetical protein
MRTAADDIFVSGVAEAIAANPGISVAMGYDDGNWPDAAAIAAAYPGMTVIRITTNPNDDQGDMLDLETGNGVPAQGPPWIAKRRQQGHGGPLLYFPDSWRQDVLNAFSSQGVPLPGLFPAAYPGPGPVLINPVTDVGHQYIDVGDYDLSVVVDYLPGIDPSPSPIPPSPEVDKMPGVSPFVNANGQRHRTSVFLGALGHYYRDPATGAWHGQNVAKLADPSNGPVANISWDPDQVPTIQVDGAWLVIGAVDIHGTAFEATQAVGSPAWGIEQVIV